MHLMKNQSFGPGAERVSHEFSWGFLELLGWIRTLTMNNFDLLEGLLKISEPIFYS
jgi:hypothetical protein